MDVEDVGLRLGLHMGSNECAVRVMVLVSFLLHCNASGLVLEILKHDNLQ